MIPTGSRHVESHERVYVGRLQRVQFGAGGARAHDGAQLVAHVLRRARAARRHARAAHPAHAAHAAARACT